MTISKIEWTDRTWNPTTGCTKVSPGCDHCYAEGIAHRFAGTKAFPRGFDVTLHEDRIDAPRRWRKPARVFVNSMSDLFHDAVPDLFITRVFDVMEQTPHHTYQVLTKRHGRMRSFVQAREAARRDYARQFDENPIPERRTCPAADYARHRAANPPANIWLGVSVEDQKRADLRIPALLDTPAAVRFLSCEPLLGAVDLTHISMHDRGPVAFWEGRDQVNVLTGDRRDGGDPSPNRIHWVIAGGESGPSARPMHPAWARHLRSQCQAADVPFFFKQWGEWSPAPWTVRVCDPAVGWTGTEEELAAAKRQAEAIGATVIVNDDGDVYEPPYRCWSLERDGTDQPGAMRRAGKKAAGRELDGRTWDEFPVVAR